IDAKVDSSASRRMVPRRSAAWFPQATGHNLSPGRKWSSRMSQSSVLAEPNAEGLLEIQTTRFGLLTVEPDRILTFSRGLLGFPQFTRYALIQAGIDNYFFWLQCVDDPNLAFVVTDPSVFFQSYEVPLKEEAQEQLDLTDAASAQILVICNKVGDWLTGNLLGPIV